MRKKNIAEQGFCIFNSGVTRDFRAFSIDCIEYTPRFQDWSTMSLKYIDNARKILCIGRNYAAHIKELNNMAPSQPFFFLKPSSSVLRPNNGPFLVPKGVVAHYEVELAFTLNKTLKNLPPTFSAQEALDAIEGYALAIDFTARNVQDEAKKKGLPWSIGKGFDTFLPLSGFIPKEKIPDPYNVRLSLSVNGETKQDDMTNLMIFPIHRILSHMSAIMTLEKGDLILTGTPKGVGPVKPGDHIEASLSVDGDVLEKIDITAEEKPGPYEYKEI
ncbi:hypothetical protein E0198_003756 [Clavispora lusitaniae]|nr:hypothetical protein E0198_003756 [Clavispora lusitaniae]